MKTKLTYVFGCLMFLGSIFMIFLLGSLNSVNSPGLNLSYIPQYINLFVGTFWLSIAILIINKIQQYIRK